MKVYLAERSGDWDSLFIEVPQFDAEVEYWSRVERVIKKWKIVNTAELNDTGDPILITEKRIVYPDGWFESGADHTEEEYYLKRVIQVPRYYLTFIDLDEFSRFMLEHADALEVEEHNSNPILVLVLA